MTQQPGLVPLPLRLPRLSRNEAQARTVVAQGANALPATLGGQPWTLTLTPLASRDTPGFAGDDWHVQAEWAGARFALRLPAGACDGWIRARFPQLDLPALAPEMRAAALEDALSEALAAVNAMQRGPARIEKLGPADDAAAQAHAFGIELASGAQVLYGTLATDGLGLMLMAGALAQRAPSPGPVEEDAVTVLLRAEVGQACLSAGLLESLRVGDAVMLEPAWIAQDGTLRLVAGDWALAARQEEGARLSVVQPFTRMGLSMSTENTNNGAGESPARLDDLPVQLHFDIGERTLTLGELKALQPGQSIELGRPLASPVNIRANGTLVGRGELVEIDGRLAVSITSLGAAG